jgi:hypothetical protein
VIRSQMCAYLPFGQDVSPMSTRTTPTDNTSVSVPWKVEDYIAKAGKRQAGNLEREKALSEAFPGIHDLDPSGKSKVVDVPLSVADVKGRYLFWYLPSIISKARQVRSGLVFQSIFLLMRFPAGENIPCHRVALYYP